ncbi:MAG: cell division protein FtsL [Anaerolineae bacterium]|nr:MAG: cell division protein FtsL [Anaerolineae bacterium]
MTKNGSSVFTDISSQSHHLGPMNLRRALRWLVLVVIAGLVGWVYLSQASRVAETEHHIRELRQQRDELQRQNDQLTYEVGRLGSVERLTGRARELGYVAVWQARFVAVTSYPAREDGTSNEPTALSQGVPAGRATPSVVAVWWQTVADQFEVWTQTGQP